MAAPEALPPSEARERLPAIFLGILVVELLAIAGLFWMGEHFAR